MAGMVAFVGREPQLSRLLGAVAGDAGLVVVTGDAGVGMDKLSAPDVTAVLTALWRRAHLLLDDEPHVFEDDLGFRLANVPEVLAAAGIPAGEAWLGHPGIQAGPWRASMVARARLVEDLVADRARDGVARTRITGRDLPVTPMLIHGSGFCRVGQVRSVLRICRKDSPHLS